MKRVMQKHWSNDWGHMHTVEEEAKICAEMRKTLNKPRYVEIPKPEPTTLEGWNYQIQKLAKEAEEMRRKPLPMPIDSKNVSFVDEDSDVTFCGCGAEMSVEQEEMFVVCPSCF